MLYNRTRKAEIIKRVRFADSLFARAKGLMFEREKNFDYALVFPFKGETRARASIHMLFVFFPIAAVYLDSRKSVVDIAVLKPFKLNYTPKRKAKYLVELPAGKAKKISIGDRLGF